MSRSQSQKEVRKQVSFWIPVKLMNQLRDAAAAEGLPMSVLMERLVREYLNFRK